MGKPNFSDEFKRDAVAQITDRGYPVAEVSQRLHAVVDGQGLPIRLSLTAGQSHDGLLDLVGAGTIVLADKAYDADRIRASLREKEAFANIPPKANRRSKPYFST